MKLFIIVIFILILVLCLIYLFYKLFKNNRVKIKGSYIIPTDLNNMTDTSKILNELFKTESVNNTKYYIYNYRITKIDLSNSSLLNSFNDFLNNDIKIEYKNEHHTTKKHLQSIQNGEIILKTSSKKFDDFFKDMLLLIYNFYNSVNGYRISGYVPANINYVSEKPNKQNGGEFYNTYNETEILKQTKDLIFDSFKKYDKSQTNLIPKTFIPDFIIKMSKNKYTNYLIIEFDENNYFHQERTNFEYMSKCVVYNEMLKNVKKEEYIKLNVLRITYEDGILEKVENKQFVVNYLISSIDYVINEMCKNNGLNGAYILERFELNDFELDGYKRNIENKLCCSIELKNNNVDFLPNNIDFNRIIYLALENKFSYKMTDKNINILNPVKQQNLDNYIIKNIDKKDDIVIENIKKSIVLNIRLKRQKLSKSSEPEINELMDEQNTNINL